jgi:DNA-binding CsgD family transcriptional regulator
VDLAESIDRGPVVVPVTRAQLEDALDALGEASDDGGEIVWLRVRRLVGRADRAVEDPLTPREHEVVELVAQGLSNVEIADRLYISKRTVESHLEHVKEKLGHGSRHQVMAWALRSNGPSSSSEADPACRTRPR